MDAWTRGRRAAGLVLLSGFLGTGCAPSSSPVATTKPRAAARTPKAPKAGRVETANAAKSVRASESERPTARPPSAAQAVLELDPSVSTSLGAPGNGTLTGAAELPATGPGFRFNPNRPHEARYGTVEMVQALVRAASVVAREFPGSELTLNDLSLENGGPIPQHGSHQNGRDADVLFYLKSADGRPVTSVGAPIDPDGRGTDYKELSNPDDDVPLELDRERTWRFLWALLEDPQAHLQRIFVVEHVRGMLLEEAHRSKAPAELIERFSHLTCQPGTPHDDHFHFRFFCSAEDVRLGCEDKHPMYPWHKAHLAAAGTEPVMARPGSRRQRRAVRERTTSRAEARTRAGPMHASVRRFLERREGWSQPPHPGRPYCR